MLETMTSFMMAEHLAGHTMVHPREMGYQRLMSANRRPFKTADGYMAIALQHKAVGSILDAG